MATLDTNVTLNGGTVDITVYEDIGNTGSADNQTTISVADGSDTNTISSFSEDSGNAYWFDADLTASGIETSPTVNSVDLTLTIGTDISGTVTKSDSSVEGVKIYAIDTTNGDVEATTTTDVNGDYTVTVESGLEVDIVAQYDDGVDKYNTYAKPYLNT